MTPPPATYLSLSLDELNGLERAGDSGNALNPCFIWLWPSFMRNAPQSISVQPSCGNSPR